GLYETFRVVDPGQPNHTGSLEIDVVLRSPISAAELEARVAWVSEKIASLVPNATAPTQRYESPTETVLPRFWGAAGEAWARTRKGRFAPVDINLGYASVEAAITRAEALLVEHRELAWVNL